MKITDIKAVYPKWPREPGKVWQSCFWQIVVRIDTDVGVTGYGVGGVGEPGALVINRHLRRHLLDRTVGSVDDIRAIWDDLYFASLPYGRAGIPRDPFRRTDRDRPDGDRRFRSAAGRAAHRDRGR